MVSTWINKNSKNTEKVKKRVAYFKLKLIPLMFLGWLPFIPNVYSQTLPCEIDDNIIVGNPSDCGNFSLGFNRSGSAARVQNFGSGPSYLSDFLNPAIYFGNSNFGSGTLVTTQANISRAGSYKFSFDIKYVASTSATMQNIENGNRITLSWGNQQFGVITAVQNGTLTGGLPGGQVGESVTYTIIANGVTTTRTLNFTNPNLVDNQNWTVFSPVELTFRADGVNQGLRLDYSYYDLGIAVDNFIIQAAGPDLQIVRESLYANSNELGYVLNLQSAKTAQGLTYDCTVFDAKNTCVSFAGTRSNGGDGLDNTTGALIIAHQSTANIRVGAYVDQNIGTTDSNGLRVKRGSPGYGVFGVWSQRADGLGTQIRIAANTGKVEIETSRLLIDTAEVGFGQSNIKSNGVQIEASQGYAFNNQWITRPYVGYRQITNKRGAYIEQTSASVEYPLAYTALKQTTESILAGVRFIGKLTPQTSLNLSAGVERDVKSVIDAYQATIVDGEAIEPINMTQNIKKTRPTASVGLVHSLDKTQTVGLFVMHRKEALQSSSTTSGMLQYSAGF